MKVFNVLRSATHPMTIAEAAQSLGMPEKSVRDAVAALHAQDLVLPASNRRRGQVWMADKAAVVAIDLRGRLSESLANLRRGRGA